MRLKLSASSASSRGSGTGTCAPHCAGGQPLGRAIGRVVRRAAGRSRRRQASSDGQHRHHPDRPRASAPAAARRPRRARQAASTGTGCRTAGRGASIGAARYITRSSRPGCSALRRACPRRSWPAISGRVRCRSRTLPAGSRCRSQPGHRRSSSVTRTPLACSRRRQSCANGCRSSRHFGTQLQIEKLGQRSQLGACGIERRLLEQSQRRPADAQDRDQRDQQAVRGKQVPQQASLGHGYSLKAVANPSHRFDVAAQVAQLLAQPRHLHVHARSVTG